jgi:hypothetical protein
MEEMMEKYLIFETRTFEKGEIEKNELMLS